MNDLQKMGGWAALLHAATFAVGIVLLVAVLIPAGFEIEDPDPVETVEFYADNEVAMYVLDVLIYLASSIVQVVLVLALYARLKNSSAVLIQTATAFGLIWAGVVLSTAMISSIAVPTVIDLYQDDPAQAGTVWAAIDVVRAGLGGGTELVGGLWFFLVSWAALQTGSLPRGLNILGLLVGAAGIMTIIPPLAAIPLFGLSSIVWFIWAGVVMLRSASDTAENVVPHHSAV